MDANAISALITAATTALQPYWPVLATKAAESAGEHVPEAVVNLWAAVKERFARKPTAQEVLDDLPKNPDDPALKGAFEFQLRKLLQEDLAFADDLRQQLHGVDAAFKAGQTGSGNILVQQQGSGNVTITTGESKKA